MKKFKSISEYELVKHAYENIKHLYALDKAEIEKFKDHRFDPGAYKYLTDRVADYDKQMFELHEWLVNNHKEV